IWAYLTWVGVGESELTWFLEHRCPPDVVGINYYVTSERVLDEHKHAYPRDRWGGNGRDSYADMEAPRVRVEGSGGWRVLLREAWERYHLPVAATEVHLGGPADEQLRWLSEAWNAGLELRQQGVNVRAVTAWSLFGAYDWNQLVTSSQGFYEPGVFDVRAPRPRPTALAGVVRQLARGESPTHPVLDGPGWWRRPDRFTVPPISTEAGVTAQDEVQPARSDTGGMRPVLITGATGTLGQAFARICQQRGLAYRLCSRADMDIAHAASVARTLDAVKPWAVINTAGYVRVDDAERDVERCLRENTSGPAVLSAACALRGVRLVTFSSDLVFDGSKGAAYVERDPVAPLNVYGRSKAEAERLVLGSDPTALIIRTSAFFGPWDTHNFVYHALRALGLGEEFWAASDAVVSPTYVPDLVHASLDLLVAGEQGVWHLTNAEGVTWAALAQRAAELAGISIASLRTRPIAELGLAAARPLASALQSERGWIMPPLEDALARYLVAPGSPAQDLVCAEDRSLLRL
ncbi:MAG: sugar nucleotide-binding protein, partial [Chloroflexota bacterium]